jgi:protein-disulfide isomerase
VQDGDRARVEGTPTLFINGKRFNGAITTDNLGNVINDQLKTAKPVTASNLKP